MSDQDIKKLEDEFLVNSGSAFVEARERVLQSGQCVMQTENGVIYEVSPDGRRRAIKNIEPPITFPAGELYTIS